MNETPLKTAETELQEQQLRLAQEESHIFMESVANSSDAVGMSTPEGKHYFQNKAYDELFGHVGENPPETLFVDPAVGHEVFRTVMAGERWTGEVQMYARDRRILDILLRAYANQDQNGRITALVGIHTDITARKRAEASLRSSEHEKALILDNAGDIIAYHDKNMCLIWANQTYLKGIGSVTGTPARMEDVKGRNCCETWKLTKPCIGCPVSVALRTGETNEAELTPENQPHWPAIQGSWHIKASPVHDAQGNVIGAIEISRNITERKRTEALLHIKDLAVASAIAGIAISDMDGKINYVNAAWMRMHGHDSDTDVLGTTPLLHVRNPADAETVIKALKEKGVWTGELVCRRHDGSYFTAELATNLMTDSTNRPMGLLASFQDITEQKKLEAERRELDTRLHQTQRVDSLGVLAGGIAHDFNNILMAILGHADLALDEMSPLASGRESIQQIKTAAMRAAELCTQMLAYSGKGHLEKQDFCLSNLVDEMLHMLRTCISKKCVLNLNLEKQLLLIHADASQIRQVLMNLVMNASDAIGDRSGSITVTTGAVDCSKDYLEQNYIVHPLNPGVYVYLEVSDTGCGMSRETIQRMFEPFFTTKFTGRGLGLSAILGIVKAHGGALRVYSELGKGTTIKVLFPARDVTGVEGSEPPAESQWYGRGTVLLVDDEETVRAVTGKLLERLGLDVLAASDGREGVALYRDRKDDIAVVLLDLTMPHMNGEEAFRQLRQINPDVRVILASGYSENDIATRFAGKGLVGCMQKPYTLARLRSLLSAVIPAADFPGKTDQNPEPNQVPEDTARNLADPQH